MMDYPTKNGQTRIELYPHQIEAVDKLRTGSILNGGVGSGKSLTAIRYYFTKVPPWKGLYIITTAKKRDSLDWEKELESLYPQIGKASVKAIDSWNNIRKYVNVDDHFFIFDEQRVIGSGAWVKSFLKITKKNDWILLTATPGDTWMDYIPVFIANGFYKNRTQFIKRHVVYNRYTKFPKVDFYREEDRLAKLKDHITIEMDYESPLESVYEDVLVEYDKDKLDIVVKQRWNPYVDKPLRAMSGVIYVGRKVINSDPSRLGTVQALLTKHRRIVIFYNFNYELEILRQLNKFPNVYVGEYNGFNHDPIPKGDKWVYLVQYLAGNEGWNCIQTNAMVFYSLHYSYRIMTQAAGRIDRLNTPFSKLFYYRLISNSFIDKAIVSALNRKKDFNTRTLQSFLGFSREEQTL